MAMSYTHTHTNTNVQARMGMHMCTQTLKVGHSPGICLLALITVTRSRQVVYEEANVLNQITVKRNLIRLTGKYV